MGFLGDVWGGIKGALKGFGRGIAGIFGSLYNLGTSFFNRILGFFSFLLDLIIAWPEKKLRLNVVILRQENGSLLHPTRDLVAESDAAYELAATVLKDSANVRVVAHNTKDKIEQLEDRPPRAALYPRCGFGGILDMFGEAGWYYIVNRTYSALSVFTGYGTPLTVFIVMDVRGKEGCSMGPLANYITLDLDGLIKRNSSGANVTDTTMVHEVGHACGLWHHDSRNNLMKDSSNERDDTKLTRFQRAFFRNSKHVTVL